MTKTKVLFLARRYAPHVGGVETHVEHLSQFLLQKNYAVTIITERFRSTDLSRKEIIDGAFVYRIDLPKGQTSKWRIWWWCLLHLGVFLDTEIIHIHDVFFWIIPIYPLLWIMRKKIFITFHGYEAPGPLTPKQIRWHQIAEKYTRGNICVGGFHRKYYGVKPTTVTYGGVETVNAHHSQKNKKLIFVGRLSNDTGIKEYLQALQLLQEKKVFCHLDVMGDGDLRDECQNFAKEHHLDVTFHGFVEHAAAELEKYEVVFASQYLSILDAMSQGCAVIAYANTPIKKDYLSMTPFAEWITITYSVKEIAEAIEHPRPVSKHGTGWAKKQTWEKLGKEYVELWKK